VRRPRSNPSPARGAREPRPRLPLGPRPAGAFAKDVAAAAALRVAAFRIAPLAFDAFFDFFAAAGGAFVGSSSSGFGSLPSTRARNSSAVRPMSCTSAAPDPLASSSALSRRSSGASVPMRTLTSW
jgi:hypothetical protein